MIETIKKSLLTGIGAAVVTKDKIEEMLSEFVKEGKVTADDARKMAEKVAAQGRQEFHKACAELTAKVREMTADSGDKTKGAASALEKRFEALEEKLGGAVTPKQKRPPAAQARRPAKTAKPAKPVKRARPAKTAKAAKSRR